MVGFCLSEENILALGRLGLVAPSFQGGFGASAAKHSRHVDSERAVAEIGVLLQDRKMMVLLCTCMLCRCAL